MEFPDLGSTCSVCNKLDFLPFVCVHCVKVLCKEHLLPISHKCPEYVDKVVDPDVQKKEKIRCKFCKEHITQPLEQICCPKCNLIHCLRHRLPESHECPKLKEEYLQRIRSQVTPTPSVKKVVAAPKVKGSKNEELARKVSLMKLKQKARGPSVPNEERVYFFVESNNEKHSFYFSKTWTFGKCLDFILETLRVNRSSGRHALNLSNEELLPFDVTVEQIVNERRVSSGDCLILKSLD